MSFRDLLNLLEGNQVRVQVKGSHVTFKPAVVYFTSDRHWSQWLFPKGPDRGLGPMSEEEQAQLGRRISLCEEIRPQRDLNQALGMNPSRGGGGHNTVPASPASPPTREAFISEAEMQEILKDLFPENYS